MWQIAGDGLHMARFSHVVIICPITREKGGEREDERR